MNYSRTIWLGLVALTIWAGTHNSNVDAKPSVELSPACTVVRGNQQVCK